MSWWSDGEAFDEYDMPWCETCQGGESYEQCRRCSEMHMAMHEETEDEQDD